MFRTAQMMVEFLLTYGWAFLMIISLLAGLIAIDPVSMTSTPTRCISDNPLIYCQDPKAKTTGSGVAITLQNNDFQSIVLTNATVTQVNEDNTSKTCTETQKTIRSGDTTTITCKDLNLTRGQSNEITIRHDEYNAKQGPSQRRTNTVTVDATPNPSQSLGGLPAPTNTTATLNQMAGTGTTANPYLITNVQELQAIEADMTGHYAVANDIDAATTTSWNNGSGFNQIGSQSNRFKGTLDGQDNTVHDIYIDRPGENEVGIIGYLNDGSGEHIKDLHVRNADVTGRNDVGIIVGDTDAPIRGSSTTGTVNARFYAGGLTGDTRGKITNAWSSATVTAEYAAGGLIGKSYDTIEDSYATGTVKTTTYRTAGGLIGTTFGGGYTSDPTEIQDSYADASVTSDEFAGGLVGYDYKGTTKRSYATGTVTGENNTGGLIGQTDGSTVTDSYASTDVNGDNGIGGLIGKDENSDIQSSYATGSITASTDVGGVLGRSSGTTGSDLYWDEQSTGVASDAFPAASTGLQTSEMEGSSAETNMSGFDFTSTWTTAPGSYPDLAWD